MDKTRRSQIIFGCLVVIAVIVWVSNFSSVKGQKVSFPDTKNEEEMPLSQLVSRLSSGSLPPPSGAAKTLHDNWGHNPFILTPVKGGMVLQGIIWDPAGPKALINDEIVGIGDQIGTMKVLDIQNQKVILNDGTKDIELVVGP